jgi:hypothetical protein
VKKSDREKDGEAEGGDVAVWGETMEALKKVQTEKKAK